MMIQWMFTCKVLQRVLVHSKGSINADYHYSLQYDFAR